MLSGKIGVCGKTYYGFGESCGEGGGG